MQISGSIKREVTRERGRANDAAVTDGRTKGAKRRAEK
jgi:hypothetical protein